MQMTCPCSKAQPGLPGTPSVRSLLCFRTEALHTWACRSLQFEKSKSGASGQSPRVNYPGLGAFWPHSLVVLGSSQGAGRSSYFHWATDQVLLSGREQGLSQQVTPFSNKPLN